MSDRSQFEADRVDRADRRVIEQAAAKPGNRSVAVSSEKSVRRHGELAP